MTIKSNLKKIIGSSRLKKIRPLFHGSKSFLSAFNLGFPANKLKLIGINATKGKTSTVIMTGRLMNLVGLKTGYLSTAIINTKGDRNNEELNTHKMTTLDGTLMQNLLQKMVENGCQYVVLEMSSQGLEQNRHWGLGKFWMTVFMNLYPEHIEAHGSLENYIIAKQKLFAELDEQGVFVANTDSEQIEYTQKMEAVIKAKNFQKINLRQNEHFEIKLEKKSETELNKVLVLENGQAIDFGREIANFELVNLAFAHKIVSQCLPQGQQGVIGSLLPKVLGLPGRMEFVVKHSQVVFEKDITEKKDVDLDISILVDYAHEPESLRQMLETIQEWKKAGLYTQVVHILSNDGAGRDDWKKPIMGDLSLQLADFTILTTDNYDINDDPKKIVDLMSQNFENLFSVIKANGVQKLSTSYQQIIHKLSTDYPQNKAGENWFWDIDRKKAMKTALKIAKSVCESNKNEKILIVSTGVGTEQGLTQPEGVIKWDERRVWVGLWNEI
jgi:UDP-N-acetylmuramoyl-L-alanyl-D-glutamate--2,6-diaminopimelate ligase